MAVDNSPPRILAITLTGIVSVVLLIALKPILDSYYVTMFEAEEYRKVSSVAPTELIALHKAEAKSFASAPIPLDRAMTLVAKGRAEPIPGTKDDGILPQQSTDTGALIGWAMLPPAADPSTTSFVAPATPAPAADASVGAPVAAPAGSAAVSPGAPGTVPPPAAPSASAVPSAVPSASPAPSAAPPPHT